MPRISTDAFASIEFKTRFLLSPLVLLAFGTACGGSTQDDAGATAGNGGGTTVGSGGASQGNAGGNSPGGTGGGDQGNDGGSSSGGTGGDGQGSGTGGNSTVGSGGAVAGVGGAIVVETVECTGALPKLALDGVEHTVSVVGANSWGELPHFWNTYGTGHLGLYLREDRGWGETLKAHTVDGVGNLGLTSVRQHGLFHDDIGIYSEDGSGNPVYDFTKSDEIFDFLIEVGIEPIIELAPMPSALASDPSYTVFDWDMIVSPPKDYDKWQELVRTFVQHSIDRYGESRVEKWYFEVWNEPECCSNKFWKGTLDDYYRLYDYSAAGVRAALPTGRVGGPVASQPRELTAGSSLGRGFLNHITEENYATPGNTGLLDFFSYHSWSFIDGSVNGYFQGLDLLDSYGFNDVQIAITEFGPTYEFGLNDEPQEMHQGAAFVAQTYSDISQRAHKEGKRFPLTYSWWVLSDIFEEGLYREEDPFIGCMGLISRENIKKPAYNAYKFLAAMGNEQLDLSVQGSGDVGGMAARDNRGGVQIIVYNAQDPGVGPGVNDYYAEEGEHQIGVTLSGLDPDLSYDVTSYRIDNVRGNAYAAWQGQGRPSMAEMSEANWQELRNVMESPAEPIGTALCGDSFSQSFSLSSPGVLFVTLSPSIK